MIDGFKRGSISQPSRLFIENSINRTEEEKRRKVFACYYLIQNLLIMNLTIGDQYYLKARDYYPYNMEFVVENLNYALSYDDEHTQANFLLGKVYMYLMKDYGKATQCFEKVLRCNLDYADVYKHYSLLKIWLKDYDGARKLINYGEKVKGMDVSTLLILKAIIYECRGEYHQAKALLKRAKLYSIDVNTINKIKLNLTRVKDKIKTSKPKKRGFRTKLAAV